MAVGEGEKRRGRRVEGRREGGEEKGEEEKGEKRRGRREEGEEKGKREGGEGGERRRVEVEGEANLTWHGMQIKQINRKNIMCIMFMCINRELVIFQSPKIFDTYILDYN